MAAAVAVKEEDGVSSVAGAMATGTVLGPEGGSEGSLTAVASPLGYPCWSVEVWIPSVFPLAPAPDDEEELLSGSSSTLISGCGGCITGTGTAVGVGGAF